MLSEHLEKKKQMSSYPPSTLGAHAQRGLLYLGLSVCLSVCVSVKSHLTNGASVRSENVATYSAGNEGQKICGDLPETTALKSYTAKHERKSQYANFSDLPAVSFLRLTYSEAPEGTQRLSTTFSLAQNDAYCCFWPVLERELTASRVTANGEAWPISAHAHWDSTQDSTQDCSMRRGFARGGSRGGGGGGGGGLGGCNPPKALETDREQCAGVKI